MIDTVYNRQNIFFDTFVKEESRDWEKMKLKTAW